MVARFWPVSGVVGENGAFYFRYDHAARRMIRHFAASADELIERSRSHPGGQRPGLATVLGAIDRLVHIVAFRQRGLQRRKVRRALRIAPAFYLTLAFAWIAGLTPLPRSPAWTNSGTGYSLAQTAIQLKPWLPPALANRLKYN